MNRAKWLQAASSTTELTLFHSIRLGFARFGAGSTWYREGDAGSCTETPYAAAYAIVDWLVQSWNVTANGERIIDVFPGVDDVIELGKGDYVAAPSRIAASQFWRMGAEGGMIISGKRVVDSKNDEQIVSRTSWVGVERGVGGLDSVLVRLPTMERPIIYDANLDVKRSGRINVEDDVGEGFVRVSGMDEGDIIVLFSQNNRPEDGFVFDNNGGWASTTTGGAYSTRQTKQLENGRV